MPRAGESRRRLARTLNAAYGEGLISEETFAGRVDLLLRSTLLTPAGLVGDLTIRPLRPALRDRLWRALRTVCRTAGLAVAPEPASVLLALDWTGAAPRTLLVGRHRACDLVLADPTVSRRHARLRFQDGHWVLRDLSSTNGTTVNGRRVVRCRLLPGDQLTLGDQRLLVD